MNFIERWLLRKFLKRLNFEIFHRDGFSIVKVRGDLAKDISDYLAGRKLESYIEIRYSENKMLVIRFTLHDLL